MLPKYNRAIGLAMNRMQRATPEGKVRIKRALVHLNVARSLETLGHQKLADALVRIAHQLYFSERNGTAGPMLDPVEPPEHLKHAIGLCMHAIKKATPEEKVKAKEALTHFNLARTVSGLGYGKLSLLLIKLGENLLTQIDPTLTPKDRKRAVDDMQDLMKPPRPAPPRHPNPVINAFRSGAHKVKTTLDKRGIHLEQDEA
jgi:hypothetical protein